ncbi:unnamed protein product [Brassica rapa subsp. narinosa]
MCKCRSHGTFPLFGLQSSHLNICYYHQDLHRRPLRPGSRPRFCSDRRALLLIEAWLLPRRPGIGRALQRHPFLGLVDSAGMLTLEPFSEDQGRSATGRMGSPQADALSTQMPRHAVRRMLQTTIKAATSPRAELGPGLSLRTLLQTTIRTPKTSNFQAGLFPSFWTGTSDYMTRIKFTTACQDASDVLSSDFGQPRAVTHGRSASVPYPREDGGTMICDTQADVPSARRLGAQLAFKDSMVHGILQFTPSIAFCYVLHRCESRDIRCRESF